MSRVLLGLSCLLLTMLSVSAQTLISDNFSSASPEWVGVNLSGGGNFNLVNGSLQVSANSNAAYAVYNTQVLSGHFYTEVDFTQDDNVGLALFKAKADGTPDLDNYSLIKVEQVNGKTVVSISDRQNGNADVLDNTGLADKNLRYKNTLDATTFSLPYTSTNKKLRIFRHANEQFLHFSYSVKKNIDGQDAEGWIELAPSKEWAQLNGNFLMGLVALDGSAIFDNAFAVTKPLQDLDDSTTGFQATWREVNWSGYFGDALVVTFDAAEAPLTGGSRKFIFWEAFNNVPAWYLDNSLMYTYEFVETWDGGSPGAHEPMSDRLRRFSKVTLDYDGPDYKLIHWEYVLLDPDYRWPDFGSGTDKPVVDEYYKIYPDGTILRKIRYKAKLDSQFRNWHELTELIVVTGNVTDPSDHLASPPLSIWPINGQRQDFNPTGPGNNYEQSNNDATILAVHMQNHPDLVNAFNDNASSPTTYAGDPITIYKTWHDKNFHMSHWPINKEQYHSDPFKSQTTWKEQIKHASLAGAGVYENMSDQWTSNFQIDPVDGRKYREWISYMSLSPRGNLGQARTNVQTWLNSPWDWGGTATPTANLALNQPVVTSSNHNGTNVGPNAVDNDASTRWESAHGSDNEWIYVNLGDRYEIDSVVINWEAAYSSKYRIEVSDDAANWSSVYVDNSANGGVDNIALTNAVGSYCRIVGTERGGPYGHSIWEFEVYGSPAASPVDYTVTASAGANGSISPEGIVSVAENGNQSFTITPNTGYEIADVLVDNVSQGAIATYTFSNVTADRTISATFQAVQSSVREIGFIEAEDYTAMQGVQTENTSDAGGGRNVGWINTGDWMEYEVNVVTPGEYVVDFRVASQNNNIRFDLLSDNSILTSINSSTTNGWQNWKTVSSQVNLAAGVQTLRVQVTGNGWNINWLDFTITPPSQPCNVNWTGPNQTINRETLNWTSEQIDISCAAQVDISVRIEGAGPMENADYLDVYYRVDGGPLAAISENTNAFASKVVAASGINGNTLEIVINGFTSWNNEFYYINDLSVSEGGTSNRAMAPINEAVADKKIIDEQISFSTQVYPNPVADGQLNVRIFSQRSTNVDLRLRGVDGRVVLSRSFEVLQGQQRTTLDVSSLPKGMYVLSALNGTKMYSKRVMIVN